MGLSCAQTPSLRAFSLRLDSRRLQSAQMRSSSPLTPQPFSQRARASLKAILRLKLYPQLLALLRGRLRRGLLRYDRQRQGPFGCRHLCPGPFPA